MTAEPSLPGIVIAAPRSGAGKTTIALGLMRALAGKGRVVQPFKCGPDYIDPAFHAAATGRASYNLDSWAMSAGAIRASIATAGEGADIAIAEGSMGLFDGAGGGQAGTGASADVAALTGWPVVLVLDVSGQAETAAAVALGCARYRDDVRLAGAILNRVASERHLTLVRRGFARIGLPVLGHLMRDDTLVLPERHLGLVQAAETGDLALRLDALAARAEAGIDLAALEACAIAPPGPSPARGQGSDARIPPPGQRIAVARDRAFTFLYPHLVAAWRAAGAELLPFSPLADEAPREDADAVWLPGGYPELHAGTLAAARRFKAGLTEHAARGTRIHGECGGYMVLGRGLVDAQGVRHEMAGLLGLETSFARRKMHLGYRRATLRADGVLGAAGAELTGHEFHYATTLAAEGDRFADCRDADGRALPEGGLRAGSVSGTFFHVIDRVVR